MTAKSHILGVLCMALGLGSCLTNDSTNHQEAIRQVREASNQAIAAHDTAAIAQTLTPDYRVVTSRNAESDKDAMLLSLGKDMSIKPDLVYRRTPEEIRVFAPWKMASESGHWSGQWTEANGDKIELTGTYYAKWHQVDGSWKIRAEVFTPLTCTGGSYCDQGPLP